MTTEEMVSAAIGARPMLERAARVVPLVVAGVLLTYAAALFAATLAGCIRRGEAGQDLELFRRTAQMWLSTGQAYFPSQLSGPFIPQGGQDFNLYPPIALYLFAPFVVLPAVLWWAIPLGGTAWIMWRLHPARWTWPVVAWILTTPGFAVTLAVGNPTMWTLFAVALAVRRRSLAWLLAFKPSAIPMLLIAGFGIAALRTRSWWLGGGLLLLLSLPFGSLWLDYVAMLRNFRGSALAYGIEWAPFVCLPLVVAAGRDGRSLGDLLHVGRAAGSMLRQRRPSAHP